MRPSLSTDAFEDGQQRNPPLIFLAGPIKHWWTCWGSPEHEAYVAHRDYVRGQLIGAGYLTYAPWDALKGTWTPSAQAINDAAIAASDLMLVLTPPGVPAEGTDEEQEYAWRVNTPINYAPPRFSSGLLRDVARMVGPGARWD